MTDLKRFEREQILFFDDVYRYFDERFSIEGSFEDYVNSLLASSKYSSLAQMGYSVASVRNAIREQITQATSIGGGYYRVENHRSQLAEKRKLKGYRDLHRGEWERLKKEMGDWSIDNWDRRHGLSLFEGRRFRSTDSFLIKMKTGITLWLLTIEKLHLLKIIPRGEYIANSNEYVLYDPEEEFIVKYDPFSFLLENFSKIESIVKTSARRF